MSLGHVQCPYITPHDDDGHLNCRYREGHELPHSTCYGNDGPGLKWYIPEPSCDGQCSGLAGLHYHDRTCMRERADGSVYCAKEEPEEPPPVNERELAMYRKGVSDGMAAERARVAVERDALSSHWSSR